MDKTEKVPEDYIEVLINIVADNPSVEVRYEASYALINLSSSNMDHITFFMTEHRIRRFISILKNNEESNIIKAHIIWILANCSTKESQDYARTLLDATETVDVLLTFLDKESTEQFMIQNIFWCLGNLIFVSGTTMEDHILKIITKLKGQLKNYALNQGNFSETLNLIDIILKTKLKTIKQALWNENIFHYLEDRLNLKTDLSDLQVILKIFGNAIANYKSCVKLFEDLDIVVTLESLLKAILDECKYDTNAFAKYKFAIHDIVWITSNIISEHNNIFDNSLIRVSELPFFYLELMPFGSASVSEEVLIFFVEACKTQDNRVLMELLRLPILELFVKFLDSQDLTQRSYSLHGINLFLQFGDKLMKGINVVEQYLRGGPVYDLLVKLLSDQNNNVVDLAKNTLDYFNRNN